MQYSCVSPFTWLRKASCVHKLRWTGLAVVVGVTAIGCGSSPRDSGGASSSGSTGSTGASSSTSNTATGSSTGATSGACSSRSGSTTASTSRSGSSGADDGGSAAATIPGSGCTPPAAYGNLFVSVLGHTQAEVDLLRSHNLQTCEALMAGEDITRMATVAIAFSLDNPVGAHDRNITRLAADDLRTNEYRSAGDLVGFFMRNRGLPEADPQNGSFALALFQPGDGKVSVAKANNFNRGRYDREHSWLVFPLNNNLIDMAGNLYPRLDLHPQCGPAVKAVVRKICLHE